MISDEIYRNLSKYFLFVTLSLKKVYWHIARSIVAAASAGTRASQPRQSRLIDVTSDAATGSQRDVKREATRQNRQTALHVSPRVGQELTEIDELFYRERRGVELRVEVQHLGDVAQAVSCELHPAASR